MSRRNRRWSGSGIKAVHVKNNRGKDLKARYDSAITTPENARHWALADALSADASLSVDVRRIIRNRARYEVSNNSYARGMVLTVADDCIGTGVRLQLFSQNDEWNKRVEYDFTCWASEIKLSEKLRTMRQAKAVDGEAFATLVTNNKLDAICKLDVVPFESDRVTDPIIDTVLKGNVDGIKIDEHGNPVSYHVLSVHPGDLIGSIGEYVEIPAKNVIHWYRADRPEQHRGVSELAPALPLFAQLRRYTLAVLGAAETAADFAAVLYTDAPAGGEALQAEPFDTVGLEKRMATTLPDGWKLAQIKAEQPTTSYPDFKREILGEIARCLVVPVNVISGDSSQHNYASGRLDFQNYYKSIRIEQSHCSRVVLDKIWKAWLSEYVIASRGSSGFSYKVDMNVPHVWMFDGFEHIDPYKEARAQYTRLMSKTTSLASEYAKQGKDWEVELEQIAKERKKMLELGLVIEDVSANEEAEDE